jgi:hypothetical protein
VTALADIQRSLNAIRAIERDSSVDVRLATLALITATTAEIAKELRGVDAKPKRTSVPKPAPTAVPKPNQNTAQQQQPAQPTAQPRPFTEPEIIQKRE